MKRHKHALRSFWRVTTHAASSGTCAARRCMLLPLLQLWQQLADYSTKWIASEQC
jgi:hypothetical protein